MKTHTSVVPAGHEPRRPLLLHTRAASRRRALASVASATPMQSETAGARVLAAEIQAAREAATDRRTVGEKVLDTVVERLLDELGG